MVQGSSCPDFCPALWVSDSLARACEANEASLRAPSPGDMPRDEESTHSPRTMDSEVEFGLVWGGFEAGVNLDARKYVAGIILGSQMEAEEPQKWMKVHVGGVVWSGPGS